MKTEIMFIEGRGKCIVISDINPYNFLNNSFGVNNNGDRFSDVYAIADAIKNGKKIDAIKEVRQQLGWGLREAKEYIDRYMTSYNYNERPDMCSREAQRFLEDHTPNNWIDENDFSV